MLPQLACNSQKKFISFSKQLSILLTSVPSVPMLDLMKAEILIVFESTEWSKSTGPEPVNL